jgi:hypothetical protein
MSVARNAAIALCLITVAGCGTRGGVAKEDIEKAELMPESTAKAVVARHFGAKWAEQPYLYCDNAPKVRRISYADIEVFSSGTQNSAGSGASVWGYAPNCNAIVNRGVINFNLPVKVTDEEVRELSMALYALGAKKLAK